MTVEHLIRVLSEMGKDKVVIISDKIGWDNIGTVKEHTSTVEITFDENHPFDN
jgi:hypothetical protein